MLPLPLPGLWILLGAAIGGACLLATLHQLLWVRKVHGTGWYRRKKSLVRRFDSCLRGGVHRMGLANAPPGSEGGSKASEVEAPPPGQPPGPDELPQPDPEELAAAFALMQRWFNMQAAAGADKPAGRMR